MTNAALIVAAGRGSRARRSNDDAPKQYTLIAGQPVLTHTIDRFLDHESIDLIQVVIHGDDRALYDEAINALNLSSQGRLLAPVIGGATRQSSVYLGLQALQKHSPERVLIHDGARPFVSTNTISNVLAALANNPGAIAACPVTDTLKRAAQDRTIDGTVARDGLWRAQTPQGFQFAPLLGAHGAAAKTGKDTFTDDAAVAEWAGFKVRLVEGNSANVKLTTAEDIAMAEQKAAASHIADRRPDTWPDIRVGNGFDVHRLGPGDHLWLCGIKLAHDQTLIGHSDADVGLHALTDALFGALGKGDIGAHFPPSDAKWKGASSDRFLRHAAKLITTGGGHINHVDVTIICDSPKIGPHREAMRTAIADILMLEVQRVSVKATTSERLGFTGRGEGIAAMASATVVFGQGDRSQMSR